ncbi:MAG: molecular chaperone DnaJ [Anaerolineales bacterium]|nr:molecular chaperone DnaJ [Anaerolineales bacterium]
MADKRDYYEVLELARQASADDIRRAYRRLAKQYHPDVNRTAGAEERFKEINEAYAVLSDQERRTAYDRYGHAGVKGLPTDFGFGIADIFEEFFGFGIGGSRARRSAPRRGPDLRLDVTIGFEQAVFGVEREINFSRHEACDACGGSRAEPGTTPIRCATCNGSGEVRQVRQTFLGSMVNITTCPQCRGEGETIATVCRACGGAGYLKKDVRRVVPIPAGVDDGTQVRLTGEGEPGTLGGPPGDLYIVIHAQAHRYFRRRGDDILIDLSVNVAQAALGFVVQIPTVDGDEKLVIPAGTQSGTVLRLKAKGVPRLRRNGRGDQLVLVEVGIPQKLSAEQRRLFTELADALGTEAKPIEKSFLDGLKDFLGG